MGQSIGSKNLKGVECGKANERLGQAWWVTSSLPGRKSGQGSSGFRGGWGPTSGTSGHSCPSDRSRQTCGSWGRGAMLKAPVSVHFVLKTQHLKIRCVADLFRNKILWAYR
jgi:hypothetical protein